MFNFPDKKIIANYAKSSVNRSPNPIDLIQRREFLPTLSLFVPSFSRVVDRGLRQFSYINIHVRARSRACIRACRNARGRIRGKGGVAGRTLSSVSGWARRGVTGFWLDDENCLGVALGGGWGSWWNGWLGKEGRTIRRRASRRQCPCSP